MRALALIGCVSMLTLSTSVSAQAVDPAGEDSADTVMVDPEAVAALKRMSDYLATLNAFELTSNSTLDIVSVHDQRLQFGATVHYKVGRPGIWINFDSDLKDRQYFYDGKQFTIYSPALGFYATAPAPATNREFLKAVYDKFGISLPLEDLFRWNDGDDSDLDALALGFSLGTATIDGVATDHWAFRQGDYDWEVWIEQGARPLPRKLVIVERTDPAKPGYSARLNWTINPPLAAKDFTFVPSPKDQKIRLATFTMETEQ